MVHLSLAPCGMDPRHLSKALCRPGRSLGIQCPLLVLQNEVLALMGRKGAEALVVGGC